MMRSLGMAVSRRLGFDRNPLHRRSDRVEHAARVASLVAFLATLSLAIWLGIAAYGRGARAIPAQQAAKRPAVAVLTQDAPTVGLALPGGAAMSAVVAAARWPAPDGSERFGFIRALPGSPAGTQVPIWVDGSGQPTDRPDTARTVLGAAVVVGACTVLAGGLVLLLGMAALHSGLERVRTAAWDAEWAKVEPEWAHRRH
jgi:hypothetical protein